jgi:hypothetical protein
MIFAFVACSDLTMPGADRLHEQTIPQGMGLARIRLGAGESAQSVVRTILPNIGGYYFTLDFTAPEKTPVNKTLNGGVMGLTVALEPAVWTLEVKGYANSGMTDLKVRGNISVPVTAGTESTFDVSLTPDFSLGDTGTLDYSVSFPSMVSRAFFCLYPMNAPETSREIDIFPVADRSGTLLNLPEGAYLAVIDLYNGADNKAAVWTRVVHVYGGAATSLSPAFTPADFAACPPVIAGTTLAAKLDTALAASSGSYTIVLDGTESDLTTFMPKTLNVTENKNIAITIRGGGNEVQVDSTGTPLFTLGAAAGSGLSLAIQDLTLTGRSGNSVPVVQVNTRGTLLMKTGSLITGNVSSSPGGGVSVASGGTFTMSGGAVDGNTSSANSSSGGGGVYVSGIFNINGGTVSGNTASYNSSSYGGGVYVNGGTFSMNGGAVSGNTSSSSSFYSDSYGGGVYVSGTFSMNGGTISGNTAAASGSSYGGGVYVSGTFGMSGGIISGNTASSSSFSYGGGVYVNGGTFSMNGGAVSGNTAKTAGGVYVYDGTFSMNGGTVSGNTASSASSSSSSAWGGGMFVGTNGTFSMSGGTISGNTATSASSCGGGVYVGGTFNMSGGTISGNTSSSSYYNTSTSSYGGGVYVGPNSTFSMSGGTIRDNTSSSSSLYSYSSFSYGGGVYVRGTFSMSSGAVRGNASTSTTSSYSSYSSISSNGGGVYINYDGIVSMNGGEVSGNTSSTTTTTSTTSSNGGGVYINSGTFSMNGGTVSGNMLSGTGGRGREVLVSGTFKMSGDARPERVFLSDNTRFITISGPLSGGLTPIDLGITTSTPLDNWKNVQILRLDMSYSSGNLANLKTYFTLGNTTLTVDPYTETPITGYKISDTGLFVSD